MDFPFHSPRRMLQSKDLPSAGSLRRGGLLALKLFGSQTLWASGLKFFWPLFSSETGYFPASVKLNRRNFPLSKSRK
jgi:hypothetical protein